MNRQMIVRANALRGFFHEQILLDMVNYRYGN